MDVVHNLRNDPYKKGVRRILRTTRVVREEIFICIQNICIDGTEWKTIWVLGNKMDVRAGTAAQVKTWWSVEDFDYPVNGLNNCYECNTRGRIRRDCPSQGQPRFDVQQWGVQLHGQSAGPLLGMQSAMTWEDKVSRPRTIQDELQGKTGWGRLLLQLQ